MGVLGGPFQSCPYLTLYLLSIVERPHLVKLRFEVRLEKWRDIRLSVERVAETPEPAVVLLQVMTPPFLERGELRSFEVTPVHAE